VREEGLGSGSLRESLVRRICKRQFERCWLDTRSHLFSFVWRKEGEVRWMRARLGVGLLFSLSLVEVFFMRVRNVLERSWNTTIDSTLSF
jgi:hypothetical protein